MKSKKGKRKRRAKSASPAKTSSAKSAPTAARGSTELYRRELVVCVLLALGTIAVYVPVRHFGFVDLDDPYYVTGNPQVLQGVTIAGLRWALTTGHVANWHPLTWLSHMLDVTIFGAEAGPHHLVSLLLHATNAVLLFLLLRRASRALWPSAFVAALFALHPLHIESVAWISERKDVLSTLFWFAVMLSYVRFVERPTSSRYMVVFFAMALGLAAKPMLVTLPFVLLLFDYWPLNRVLSSVGSEKGGTGEQSQPDSPGSSRLPLRLLVKEKLPLMALSLVSSVVTYVVQQRGGAVGSMGVVPASVRIPNAVIAYSRYIGKMLWPSDPSVLYPFPEIDGLFISKLVGALLLVLGVSAIVVRLRHRRYLVTGWLWYLGTLVPVIGLVHIGSHSIADRYTYVPLVGLFILVAWGVRDIIRSNAKRALLLTRIGWIGSLAALTVSGLVTRSQLYPWRDSEALYRQALAATSRNFVIHNNLGIVLQKKGDIDEAIEHYKEALRLDPDYAGAHNSLGTALAARGRNDEAEREYRRALALEPDEVQALNNLGILLAGRGDLDSGLELFRRAIEIAPRDPKTNNNLGVALERHGDAEEALRYYEAASELDPSYREARSNRDNLRRRLRGR